MPARTHHAEFFTYEPDYFLDRCHGSKCAKFDILFSETATTLFLSGKFIRPFRTFIQ
ncbi:hypothetical protein BPC006_II2692 [Burkholderia pseudomallei BPC006]|nr:hypothetical protein BPC006_II2692 [Burkholderia pseudomallei BPC006]EEH27024.1 hypothetical protein BUH_7110 [Burkholderia pseudomallei Pakistan 9]